ncbi:methyltransferase family protein [Kribbella pratensis]|uniref:Methyltransferase family protein n=1 Tax=Kribbella pratensis TaxID=2512112 RepID=A0ABY2FIY5_9ACTN|nr:class I SAM-dependent methyltransferase [Kribbella pratensis]TDW92876.1 methyltransferase family protein [Kribbella pratensis]
MDAKTLQAYDSAAEAFADDWDSQPAGTDLQALVRRYFTPGPTADVGCGSGRDAAWLTADGFPTIGFEPSEGLLVEAKRRHPDVTFRYAALPELKGVADGTFTNVLCETVIMHLEPSAVANSVRRLVEILQPGGTLYLTWRVTEGSNQRDNAGRLYAVVDPDVVCAALDRAELLLDEESISSSSGKKIHRLIARKHQPHR